MESFPNAGKEPGLEVWGIGKGEKPIVVKARDHGKFFSSTCYIVLKTHKVAKTLMHDVYFWIGTTASKSEIITITKLAHALFYGLPGKCVQYREVEAFESDHFLSVFKRGVRYCSGGMEATFQKDYKFEPSLLHVKGSGKRVRCEPVALACRSMNRGDVFLLDTELVVYQWNGRVASSKEKIKAHDVVLKMLNEKGAKARTVVLDDGHGDTGHGSKPFWELLEGTPADILTAEDGGDDKEHAKLGNPVLYRLNDDGGEMNISTVAEKEFSRTQLDSADAFVLDMYNELYVWVGKGATEDEHEHALHHAMQFLDKWSRPHHTPVAVAMEDAEPPAFTDLFTDWHAARPAGSDAVVNEPRLYQVSDETGELLYTELFNWTQEDLCIDDVMILDGWDRIYVWVGTHCTDQERREALAIAEEFRDSLTEKRPSTRVTEEEAGYETQGFIEYFNQWSTWDPLWLSRVEARRDVERMEETIEALTNEQRMMQMLLETVETRMTEALEANDRKWMEKMEELEARLQAATEELHKEPAVNEEAVIGLIERYAKCHCKCCEEGICSNAPAIRKLRSAPSVNSRSPPGRQGVFIKREVVSPSGREYSALGRYRRPSPGGN